MHMRYPVANAKTQYMSSSFSFLLRLKFIL
jgi:hypothetical protein